MMMMIMMMPIMLRTHSLNEDNSCVVQACMIYLALIFAYGMMGRICTASPKRWSLRVYAPDGFLGTNQTGFLTM
eukprot:1047419-Prorocentrum_lima.AAC.1